MGESPQIPSGHRRRWLRSPYGHPINSTKRTESGPSAAGHALPDAAERTARLGAASGDDEADAIIVAVNHWPPIGLAVGERDVSTLVLPIGVREGAGEHQRNLEIVAGLQRQLPAGRAANEAGDAPVTLRQIRLKDRALPHLGRDAARISPPHSPTFTSSCGGHSLYVEQRNSR